MLLVTVHLNQKRDLLRQIIVSEIEGVVYTVTLDLEFSVFVGCPIVVIFTIVSGADGLISQTASAVLADAVILVANGEVASTIRTPRPLPAVATNHRVLN